MAYSPALLSSFHLDDYSLFSDPPRLAELATRVQPVTRFTYWIQSLLPTAGPFAYHAVNLALHLASIWFAAAALGRLLPAPSAFFAVTLFALHPLQTEAIAYVFARSTLLMTLCCLLALDAWTRGRHWIAVALHVVALLAKEDAVAFPLALTVLQLAISRDHRAWKPIGVMFAASLAWGARGLWIASSTAGAGAAAGSSLRPLDYLYAQGNSVSLYLLKLVPFWPLNFDTGLHPTWHGWILLGMILLAAAKYAPRSYWLLAMLAFLAPTSSLLPLDDLHAERRFYLPLIALAAALAPKLKPAYVWALALLLAALSFDRALVFRTEESLWRDTVSKSPDKLRPRLQLARAVSPTEAISILEPLRAQAPQELGRAYLEAQRPADALALFGELLAREPRNPAAITNRGTALAALGQTNAARADFERALALDPCFATARDNLARLGGSPPPCPPTSSRRP